jgi:hypothetical protein
VVSGLSGPTDHALISLLCLNGLRVSEAVGADVERLGLERGHRTLTITRKGAKVVTVPLAPRTARALDLVVGERSEGPILVGRDGRRLDRHAAARRVARLARRAGIAKRVGPHTLRHAFITTPLDAGVPLRDVQEAASHADPRTTMRYGRARVSLDRHPPTSSPRSWRVQPDEGRAAWSLRSRNERRRAFRCAVRRAARQLQLSTEVPIRRAARPLSSDVRCARSVPDDARAITSPPRCARSRPPGASSTPPAATPRGRANCHALPRIFVAPLRAGRGEPG